MLQLNRLALLRIRIGYAKAERSNVLGKQEAPDMSSHIYVVDDDPGVGRLASLIFKTEGMEVETYTSPAEALSRLADPTVPNPAAVFLDLNMPEIDGREFYRRA